MRIAISAEGDHVSPLFERCLRFTIIEIENRSVISKKSVDNPGRSPEFIPWFLFENGVEVIIAGGMGICATGIIDELGITPIMGVSGQIDEVIDQFLKGALKGGEGLRSPVSSDFLKKA